MTKDPTEINQTIRKILTENLDTLKIRTNTDSTLEIAGTKETMQGKQKVDGFYFASLMLKPKDVRLYFFPIYTHPTEFDFISEKLRKNLKGKSCFHFKCLDQELELDIQQMVAKGKELYQQDKLI